MSLPWSQRHFCSAPGAYRAALTGMTVLQVLPASRGRSLGLHRSGRAGNLTTWDPLGRAHRRTSRSLIRDFLAQRQEHVGGKAREAGQQPRDRATPQQPQWAAGDGHELECEKDQTSREVTVRRPQMSLADFLQPS